MNWLECLRVVRKKSWSEFVPPHPIMSKSVKEGSAAIYTGVARFAKDKTRSFHFVADETKKRCHHKTRKASA